MEQRFVPALRKLHLLLEDASTVLQTPIRFALIGGLAVSTWGGVRATRDIDFLADSDPSPIRNLRLQDNLKRYFEEKRCDAEWRVGEPDDPIPLILRLRLGRRLDTGADILWAYKRWHQEALQRRLEVKAGRLKVLVLHPEDLILLKLDAGGPQDLLDVSSLLASKPPDLDVERLKRTAARVRLRGMLDRCLEKAKR
jgi:hypothetical protein